MGKKLVAIALEVLIEDGVYWPDSVQQIVEASDDEIKDDVSHLVAHIAESLSRVHGVTLKAVESFDLALDDSMEIYPLNNNEGN